MTDEPSFPLLIELGTEELPVKALPGLAQAFFDGVLAGLEKRGVSVERGDARPLSTPRRLAVPLPAVATEQPEQRPEVLGPYLNVALDAEGQPTKALQGFAAKAGVEWSALERTSDSKGERFVHRAVKPGARTSELLPEILAEAVAAMPIPSRCAGATMSTPSRGRCIGWCCCSARKWCRRSCLACTRTA